MTIAQEELRQEAPYLQKPFKTPNKKIWTKSWPINFLYGMG